MMSLHFLLLQSKEGSWGISKGNYQLQTLNALFFFFRGKIQACVNLFLFQQSKDGTWKVGVAAVERAKDLSEGHYSSRIAKLARKILLKLLN